MNDKKIYTIQVIEDENLIASALEKKLKNEGFDVYVTNDGKQGLDAALEKKPDLILLDLVLPSMDGVSILDTLRGDDWGKKVPVIILTNLSKAETIQESKEKGVNSYLIKTDWKLEEVVKKVKYELGIL